MIYLLMTAGIFLLDFNIKRIVDKRYERKVRHPKLNNLIIMEKYYNDGAALNFMAKRPRLLRALHTAVLFSIGIIYYLILRIPEKRVCKTGMAFLAGGGLSNLYDRYTKGHVVDYFHINAGPERFRRVIFNISDFFIFIGAFLAAVGDEVAK